MRFVTLVELRTNPSTILDELNEDGVVTRSGKPAAAFVYLDEDTLDDFVLAHHPSLWREVEAARVEYEEQGGIKVGEIKKRLER